MGQIIGGPTDYPLLNPLTPDLGSINTTLNDWFDAQNDPNLAAFITSSVGDALVRALLAIGVLSLETFGRVIQEMYFDTAVIPTSDFRNARDHAVHLYRKVPSRVEVNLSRNVAGSSLSIPIYQQLTINGVNWYNRDVIVLGPGNVTVPAVLYRGTVAVEDYVADGTLSPLFYIGPSDWSVSDDDILVVHGTDIVKPTTKGLFQYGPTDKVFYHQTLPDGRVEAQFGDGVYGFLPLAGTTLRFLYAITDGSTGNGMPEGQPVVYPGSSDVTGITTSVSDSGNDELGSAFYKRHAPFIYAAKEKAVRKSDYESLALTYPGVVSCRIRKQSEIAPGDLRWMNILEATVLWADGLPATPGKWRAFQNWMENEIGIATVHVIKRDAVPVSVPIKYIAYLNSIADLGATQQLLVAGTQNLLALDDTSLGKGLVLSDLYRQIVETTAYTTADTIINAQQLDAIPLVDYGTIAAPMRDVILQPWEYVIPGALDITTAYSTRPSAS